MKKEMGIWIDHAKAVIVTLHDENVNTKQIESNVDPTFRLSGGSRDSMPFGAQEIAPERKVLERNKHQLHDYYQTVVQALHDADHLLIMGPGEAKTELVKAIEEHTPKMASRIRDVHPADKMTQNQLVAEVREYFCPEGEGSIKRLGV